MLEQKCLDASTVQFFAIRGHLLQRLNEITVIPAKTGTIESQTKMRLSSTKKVIDCKTPGLTMLKESEKLPEKSV